MTAPPAFFYNDATFRAAFPAFGNALVFPTPVLEMYYDTAGLFVANSNYGFLAQAGATPYCLYLMTAHLAQIGSQVAQGENSDVPISATIDKISVSVQAVALKNQWQYWLNSTEYGKQLLALLQAQSVGGFYSPGGLGRAGFKY
jgi:hypothetical protein